ncbi:MAG: hypothetical protein KDD33_06690 [Bdellovibrionales bacterium]|nr:hypothetical protein [Bdellovibrionales bacterium]
MSQKDIKLIPIPLPTEIPAPPSLENLPLDVIHSATVEMLLQQNDDLSSRLKVNIRRNSQQEQQILELKKQIHHLEQSNENLKAQNAIVKEKESIWTRQKEEKDRKLESISKEIDLLELRYNELYTTSKQNQKELHKKVVEKNQQIQILKRKLEVLHRVRTRAKDRLRNLLIDTAQGLSHSHAEHSKVKAQLRLLKKQFERLSNDIKDQEAIFRKQLDATTHISKEKINGLLQENEDLRSKIESKNSDLEQSKRELQDLFGKLSLEKKNRDKISELSFDLSQVKNEKLKDLRQFREKLEQIQEAFDNSQALKKRLELEKKQMAVELREQRETLQICEQKLVETSKENKDIAIQLERLKELWMDTQSQLEKEQVKRQTLEKINRELSRSNQQGQKERAIERAQTPGPDKAESTPQSQLNSKLTEVYASQYSSLKKQEGPAEL